MDGFNNDLKELNHIKFKFWLTARCSTEQDVMIIAGYHLFNYIYWCIFNRNNRNISDEYCGNFPSVMLL